MLTNKNIVIVAHKFLTQPDDDLVLFLNSKKYDNILHVRHSFTDAADRSSYFTWYKNGEVYKEYRTHDYKNLNESLIYLKELYFTCKWIIQSKIVWDVYIGMDGLCALFGNLLRMFSRVKKTVFWAIDFVPQKRFKQNFKNKIYHRVNIWGYKKADEMWDLGVRMAEAREKFLGVKKSEYRIHKVVPYGVWTERIKKYSYEECEKNTLVFMGHLIEKQGVQLIIKIIPKILPKIPNFRFKIIGGGYYMEELIKLTKDLNVYEYCDFRGKIEDIKELENEVAKSCVAIASYIKELDNWTYYTDPGKVKTYIACGVPILLTDIPWNAKEIEENECGKIISEDENDIVNKIIDLMDKSRNQLYRDNAIKYSKSFDYNVIFEKLIKSL